VPLRADGDLGSGVQVSWLADRRPNPPSRGALSYLSGFVWMEAPRSQLRDSSGLTPDSLGALRRMLAGMRAGNDPHESGRARHRHRKVEPVGEERELDVFGWKPRPSPAHRSPVALAGA